MVKIAIVILNWNGKDFLEKHLTSVIDNNVPEARVYVADNASTDGSIFFLQQNFPMVEIIRNHRNYGYAKGYNEALKHVDAEFFILLNSDVEVTPGWIEPVIALMGTDKNIAACQPKIRSYSQKQLFEHAGAAGGFIDKWGFPFCRGRVLNTLETDEGQYDDTREIFWATGACMFIRSEYFWKSGGFDEDFFAHMEEIDLCWRLKNMGHKIFYTSSSLVYHLGGGTLNYKSPSKTFLNFRNNLLMLYKNLPAKKLAGVLSARLILDGIAGIKFLLEGNVKHCIAVIKAHFSFYSKLGKFAIKRKAIIKNNNISGIFEGSIIFEYYFKGNRTFRDFLKKP